MTRARSALRELVLAVGLGVAAFAFMTFMIANPALVIGALLTAIGFVGLGILTMYAYVSSLGWEQRGYAYTFGSSSSWATETDHERHVRLSVNSVGCPDCGYTDA